MFIVNFSFTTLFLYNLYDPFTKESKIKEIVNELTLFIVSSCFFILTNDYFFEKFNYLRLYFGAAAIIVIVLNFLFNLLTIQIEVVEKIK